MNWGKEDSIKERLNEEGIEQIKVCFVGERKLKNWMEQCLEFFNPEDIEIEEINPSNIGCGEGGKAFRIWVRKEVFMNSPKSIFDEII